jgi:hypothetical protein
MVNNRGFIIHNTDHKKGRRHDYSIYKENRSVTPKEVVNVVDLGYLGIEKDFPEQKSSLLFKKKRNQELFDDHKNYNKNYSIKRIVIEHTICRLKKYSILADVFRNKLKKYNKVSEIVMLLTHK